MKDWREHCGPIRDQMNCGACSSFGTIGAWEPLLSKKNLKTDLSERNLFFCSGGLCDQGNTMEATLNRALKGVCLEECCPYVDYDCACGEDRCDEWWLNARKLKSWKRVTDVNEMKRLLDTGVLVGVMAVHQSFMSYISGLYHSLGAWDPVVGYHCIAIEDYDDEKGAWLLRNSWSEDWGEHGYCWIQYGDSEIDQEMFFIEPSDEAVEPDPEPEPSCPVSQTILFFGGWRTLRTLRRWRTRILHLFHPK